jgi:exosome complex exonuclease RRP6
MSTIDKLVLDSDSSDAFIRRLMSSVVLATKESNSLPQGSDYQYHAISPDFRDSAKSASNEAKSLIQQICAYVMPNESFNMSDDMADSALYEHVVDVIDSLLEGADQCLDQSKPKASNVANTVNQSLTLDKDRLLTQANRNIPKPQLDFYTTIDNMRSTSFRPRLTTKYHATVPLDDRPRRLEVSGEEDEVVGTVGPDEYFPHPYEAELRTLQHPSWCVNGKDVKNVSPTPTYSQNAFKYVDNDSDFEQMLRSLSGVTELAVDLEHHSYYTFLGLTCVMQVLTLCSLPLDSCTF